MMIATQSSNRKASLRKQKKTTSFLLFLVTWLVCSEVALVLVGATTTAESESAAEGDCATAQVGERKLELHPGFAKDCVDQHEKCGFWASIGECEKNPNYMKPNCGLSCKTCNLDSSNPNLYHHNSWGEPQEINTQSSEYDIAYRKLVESNDYMLNEVYVSNEYDGVREDCKNRHKSCTLWAALGECDSNPPYMKAQCAPACKSCEMLDFKNRCPTDDEATMLEKRIWSKPNDLNHMFESLISNPYYKQYIPIVHSKPNEYQLTQKQYIDHDSLYPSKPIIEDGPWVVTLENFVTEEECDKLIELGGQIGYERSTEVGAQKIDGTIEKSKNDKRTSTNAWCIEECYSNTISQQVIKKIENVTAIPDANNEFLQLLKYEETQFYKQHHDYSAHEIDRAEGVRILTTFLYLNDVPAGGGTNFPLLDLTVMPKRGKALLWPSVLNEDPDKRDPRTDHQALPVIEGVKYGANAWSHQRDYKEPYARRCTS